MFWLLLLIGGVIAAFASIIAGGKKGNWVVIDNSGGEILRHWVLTDAYVESAPNSDGWRFYDGTGTDTTGDNLCYVGGDAHVEKIAIPMDQFLSRYKKVLNIPEEQVPVNWAWTWEQKSEIFSMGEEN